MTSSNAHALIQTDGGAADMTNQVTTGPGADRQAVLWSLLAALAAFVALQVWRPFYFLHDDNLNGFYPVAIGAARRLWSGETPFTVPELFGGYDLLRDPAGMCLWNPFWLLLSPLALTKWNHAFVDCYTGVQLLLSSFAMAHLLLLVRRKFNADLSNGRVVFLATSYTFSIWMMVTAPNWATFIANQAALPLFFLGFWHPRRRTGAVLVACAFLESTQVGHLNSFVLCLLFLPCWLLIQFVAAGGAQRLEAREAVRRFFCGALAISPVLAPLGFLALSGFLGMGRSSGETAEFMQMLAVPAPVFAISFFAGMFGSFAGDFGLLYIPKALSSAIVLTPASYWVFHSLGARRKLSPVELATLATAALVALCVIRPLWLEEVFQHIPLLRSTRIPFRETFAFLFFVHLWIALRPVSVSPRAVRLTTALGIMFTFISLAPFRAPALAPMPLDRYLVITGKAEQFWETVRPIAARGKGAMVPIIPAIMPVPKRADVPWTLLNAYNFPAMSGLPSRSGYVVRNMNGARLGGLTPLGPIGCFYQKDIPRLRAIDPTLRFLVLRSTHPLRIELRDGDKHVPLPVPALPRVSANRWDLMQ